MDIIIVLAALGILGYVLYTMFFKKAKAQIVDSKKETEIKTPERDHANERDQKEVQEPKKRADEDKRREQKEDDH